MKRYVVPLFVLVTLLLACNLPSNLPATEAPASAPEVGEPSVPQVEISTATPTAMATDTPAPTATPQNPLVLRDTLCWIGPGNKYPVVSALKPNTRLEMLGRGSVDGWWIISNPIYKDACWVQAQDVQLEPGYDVSALKIINPPPLPTATWTPTKVPTWTPIPP